MDSSRAAFLILLVALATCLPCTPVHAITQLHVETPTDTALLPYALRIRSHADHGDQSPSVHRPARVLQARRLPSDSIIIADVGNAGINQDDAASVFIKYLPGSYCLTQDPVFFTITDYCILPASDSQQYSIIVGGQRGDSVFIARNYPGSNRFDFLFLATGTDRTGNGHWEAGVTHMLTEDYDYDGTAELFFFQNCGRDKDPRGLYCIDAERMVIEWSLPMASPAIGLISCRDSLNPGVLVSSYGPENQVRDANFDDRYGYLSRIDTSGQLVFKHRIAPMFGNPIVVRLPADSLYILSHPWPLPDQHVQDSAKPWLSLITGNGASIRSIQINESFNSMTFVRWDGDSEEDLLAVGQTGRVYIFSPGLELKAISEPSDVLSCLEVLPFPEPTDVTFVMATTFGMALYSPAFECLGVFPAGMVTAEPAIYDASGNLAALLATGSSGWRLLSLERKPLTEFATIYFWRYRNWLMLALAISTLSLIALDFRRRRALRALARLEKRNEAILNASPDLMFRISREGTFLDYQAAPGSELLVPARQFIGKKFGDVMPPELVPPVLSCIRAALETGQMQTFEYQLTITDKLQEFEARMVPSGVHEVLAIVRNITERKAQQAAVQRQAQILQQVNSAIVVTDLQGIVTDWSNGAERIIGYTAPEVLGRHVSMLYPPDEWQRVSEGIISSLREYCHFEGEILSHTKAGDDIHTQLTLSALRDGEDNPIGWIGYGIDVSTRYKAEQALRESESKFRAVTESMSAAVTIFGESTLLYCNPASELITGYSHDELLEKNFWEIIHPDFRDLVVNRGRQRLYGEQVPPRYEVKIVTKNGEERWVDYSARVIEFRGEPAVLGTAIDITDRKQAQAALQQIYEDRYEQVREIAGGVSHEIYNSLFPATSALYKLRERLQNGPQSAEDCERNRLLISLAEEAVARAIRMTETVTRYSRLETDRRDDIVLVTEVVKEVLDQHNIRIEQGNVVVDAFIDERLAVQGSRAHFFSLFANLIRNALDALEQTSQPAIAITAHRRGEQVYIKVSDNGSGIPPENLKKVFNAFYSTKPRSGTGLGLAVAKKIVEMYNGRITVESRLDSGTTFTILLPRTHRVENTPGDQTDSIEDTHR